MAACTAFYHPPAWRSVPQPKSSDTREAWQPHPESYGTGGRTVTLPFCEPPRSQTPAIRHQIDHLFCTVVRHRCGFHLRTHHHGVVGRTSDSSLPRFQIVLEPQANHPFSPVGAEGDGVGFRKPGFQALETGAATLGLPPIFSGAIEPMFAFDTEVLRLTSRVG